MGYDGSQVPLKGNFPVREDWVELLDSGIDKLSKMHGRENEPVPYETMDIIARYANNEEILFDDFNPIY